MNTNNIQLSFIGYGHYKVVTTYYGKEIKCSTTNMPAVDDYNSEPYEKDGKELRRKRGYIALRNECIRTHKIIHGKD